ncbi:toxin-antitoxin system YwqK family antitoxin [Winogradskyella wichelsiae]|uniref:toxin-antitoxin system YwqK family antitoxin n=1 Tax=Winogradskyella wichelsiae TaxID=2697007 RepID=UPI003EF3600C
MKKIVTLLVMLCVGFSFAQDKINPKLEKKDNLVVATYYHDNGEVQQTGTFDTDGKLQGEWTSYDAKGNKLAFGTYEAGKKVGKWFFWNDNKLKEVDYSENTIANVYEWSNSKKILASN